jgi:VanZ family protein
MIGSSPFKLSHRRTWIALGVTIIATIWILSLIPNPPQIGFEGEDKVGHVVAYCVMMLWWSQILIRFRDRLMIAAAFVTMGILIEFVQGWTGWRTFEVADMIADTIGVALGWCIACTPAGSALARFESAILS